MLFSLGQQFYRFPMYITNNKHQSFVYTQLNDQTVLFSKSHLFALIWNVKQFCLTHREDPVRCHYSGPEWIWEQWQWRGTQHSPKLQHYCSLTIRLFNVISRTLVGWGVLPFCRDAVGIYYSPSRLGCAASKKIQQWTLKSLVKAQIKQTISTDFYVWGNHPVWLF